MHSDQLRQHHANPHPPSSLGRSGDATLPAISRVVGPLRDSQLRPQGRVCAKARSPRTAGLAVSRGTMSVGEVQASQMPCCTPGVVGIGLPLQPVSRLARRPGSARRAGLGPCGPQTQSSNSYCPLMSEVRQAWFQDVDMVLGHMAVGSIRWIGDLCATQAGAMVSPRSLNEGPGWA